MYILSARYSFCVYNKLYYKFSILIYIYLIYYTIHRYHKIKCNIYSKPKRKVPLLNPTSDYFLTYFCKHKTVVKIE